MEEQYKYPFTWDFVDDSGDLITISQQTQGVSSEQVTSMINNSLDTILLDGSDLHYVLTVNGKNVGEINIPKDQFLKDVTYDNETKTLKFLFETENGEQEVSIVLSDLIDIYEAGNAIEIVNNKINVIVSNDSEEYLQVSADGIKVVGIDAALETKANVGVSYTKEESDAKYLTEHQDISSLATKEDVENAISDKVSEAELTEAISNVEGKIPVIPTKVSAFENDANYLVEIPSEYITESELDDKGYLTEHQDISNLATKEEVKSEIESAVAVKANASDVYTKEESDIKYLTEHQDISNLATKEDIVDVVKYNHSTSEDKKIITLENGDLIMGKVNPDSDIQPDPSASALTLIQLNKWNIVDIGSPKTITNINVHAGYRPTVQESGQSGEDAHQIAYVSDIDSLTVIIKALEEKIKKLEGRIFNTSDLVDLINNLQSGESAEIKLETDMILENGTPLTIAEGVIVNMDLNGKTLTNSVNGGAAIENNGGTLTISNGIIVNGNQDAQGSDAIQNNGGTIVINGGTFGSIENRGAAVRNNGGLVTINGGTYSSMDRGLNKGWAYVFISNTDDAEIIINDATSDCDPNGMFAANKGTITVNGGYYRMGNVDKPTFHMAYAEDGIVNLNGGTFIWVQGNSLPEPTLVNGSGAINIAEGVVIEETRK